MSESPKPPAPPQPPIASPMAARVRRLLILSALWFIPFFRLMVTADEGDTHRILRERAVDRGGLHLAELDLTVAVLAGPLSTLLFRASDAGPRPLHGGSFALGIIALFLATALGPSAVALLLWTRRLPRHLLGDFLIAFAVVLISIAWHACGLAVYAGLG